MPARYQWARPNISWVAASYPKESKVPPFMLPKDVEARAELVAIGVLAESTLSVGQRRDVASCLPGVGTGVGLAGLARG